MMAGAFEPPEASTLARDVDSLYGFLIGVSVFFSLLIAGLIIGFAVRYRRRSAQAIGTPQHGSVPLEIAWSAIPLAIALVSFFWGARVFFHISRPPANAVEYYAVGKQWMWKFQHPEGAREINTLHVPIGTPIKLTMTSQDVIHSFYVPAFRVKMDVLPGRYTTAWFQATQPGTYHLFCAEYCGTDHARMGGWVVVMEPHAYEDWLAGAGRGEARLASAEELFRQYACDSCHRPDTAARAPKLDGLFGREVRLASGATLRADENYLLESILNPNAKIVAGYKPIMPTFQGQIGPEEAMALVRYIRGLEGPAQPQAAPPAAPVPVPQAPAPVPQKPGE
jgi:cytochrome c oxidase subunit 2